MATYYKITRENGTIVLPASSLLLAVATDNNIHFTFNTGLKQDSPSPSNPQQLIQQDTLERVDIHIGSDKTDAERILDFLLIPDTPPIVDILAQVKKHAKEAQLRYTEFPTLVFCKDGTSVSIPSSSVTNITQPTGNSLQITTADNKSYTFKTSGVELTAFLADIQPQIAARLVKELDLTQFGILDIA